MHDSELSGASSRRAFRLLFELARPHRYRIVVLFILAVMQSSLAASAPWLVSICIDTGIPAMSQSNSTPLLTIGAALAACAAGSALLSYGWQKQAGRIGQLVVLDLRMQLFSKFQELPLAFHEQLSSGQVIARLTSDVEAVNAVFSVTLANLLQAIFTIFVTMCALLLLRLEFVVIIIIALVPLILLVAWTARVLSAAFGEYRGAISNITVQVVESLNGARAVHSFGRYPRNDEVFVELTERARQPGRRIQRARGGYFPTIDLIFSLSTLAILLVGASRVMHGHMEVGILAGTVLYLGQLFPPISALAMFLQTLQSALAALGKSAEVIDVKSTIIEPDRPIALANPSRGEVTFEEVSFAYGRAQLIAESAEFTTIRQLNLRLEPKQVVVMLGATGAGKSTLAKLIARFYDPGEGRILLDGVNLRDLSERDLRRSVVMLTQEGFLFAGSVADNIRIGRPSATIDEVRAVARAMGIDAFIRSLPEGYETDVRKRGSRLSAGQRQMIAFARALLVDPAVLILDEATSALDIPTERALQAALGTLLSGRTALVIAHRFSTVEMADRVLVLGNGCIVDDGTPAELLARGTGEFAALYRENDSLNRNAGKDVVRLQPSNPELREDSL